MKVNYQYFFFVFFYLSALSFVGQKGPGGVGNTDGTSNLVLWTNPDDFSEIDGASYTTWADLSGYSSDLTQSNISLRPIVKNSILNSYDVVRFEAANRRLEKTNFTNFPTTAISGFYVNNTTDTSDGVLSYASTASNNNFLIFRSGNLRLYRNNPRTFNLVANNGVWNIVGFGWTSAGGISRMSLNGTNGTSVSANQNGNPILAGGDLALAGEQDGSSSPYSFDTNQAHQGDFSEVIIFNTYITEAERIIVSNYLSAKYNISITTNDFYDEDTSGENFDFNVAGIGQAADGSNHTDSQGTGIIRMNTPSALSNDDFLFWGEDVKDANYDFSSSVSTGYLERIDTKWRVSKRNDLGTVSVSVEASDLDLTSKQSCATLKLIVSSSSTFSSKTSYDFTLSSGVYTATGVSFNDNDYFTIEYQDLIVVDGTQFYNGLGASGRPNTSDDCYKLLVKNTATGSLSLSENADVREVEVESGGKLVVDAERGLQVTNGITLNGEIRLIDKAQLIQTHTGASTITGTGSLYVDQNSEVVSKYLYNYFSSPVVTFGANNYTVTSVMKDGTIPTSASSTALNINYVGGLDGNFTSSPIAIPNRWIYTYDDVGGGTYAYNNNGDVGSTQTIDPGKGYLFKGPGRAQNYTFVGTPNDGTYTYTGIPSNVNILLGNPYPSAFDIQEFLLDNSALGSTIYLWQQADVDNAESVLGHFSNGYNGDYAIINSSTSTAATLPTEIDYVRQAEDAILGGTATVVSDKVELNSASDNISFNFIGLSQTVSSLFVVYSSNVSKTVDIDINGVSALTGVVLPNTSGILDTFEVTLLTIEPEDIVLVKSTDANLVAIDNVFARQEYTYPNPPSNYFTIGQGFFFFTDNAGTLEFNNSQRAFIPEGTSGSFFFKNGEKKKSGLPVLKLGMDFSPEKNQVFHKQIAISFKKGNSFDYDRGFDSELQQPQTTDFYWKFPLDDAFYGITGVQEITDDLEVPLEILIENSQEISIGIDVLQNIDKNIFIKDSETDIYYNISNEKAKIQLEAGVYKERFYLVFKESLVLSDNDEVLDSFIIKHNRKEKIVSIHNKGTSSIKKVTVYSLLGQKIIETTDKTQLNRKEIVLKTNGLNQTVYIVSIETLQGKITKKFR